MQTSCLTIILFIYKSSQSNFKLLVIYKNNYASPGANSEILHFICPPPPVQHRFDGFFYILGLWANDVKTLTKNKSVRKSYYRTVFDMTISAN